VIALLIKASNTGGAAPLGQKKNLAGPPQYPQEKIKNLRCYFQWPKLAQEKEKNWTGVQFGPRSKKNPRPRRAVKSFGACGGPLLCTVAMYSTVLFFFQSTLCSSFRVPFFGSVRSSLVVLLLSEYPMCLGIKLAIFCFGLFEYCTPNSASCSY